MLFLCGGPWFSTPALGGNDEHVEFETGCDGPDRCFELNVAVVTSEALIIKRGGEVFLFCFPSTGKNEKGKLL
jgi:hypothetical protein